MRLDPSSPSSDLVRPKTVKSGLLLRGHQVIVAHWRLVVSVLILAVFVPLIKLLLELNVFFLLIGFALLLIFIASQVFWIGRVLDLGQPFMPGKPGRARLAILTGRTQCLLSQWWLLSQEIWPSRARGAFRSGCRLLAANDGVVGPLVEDSVAAFSADDEVVGRRWVEINLGEPHKCYRP
jgi:hypothetical protein